MTNLQSIMKSQELTKDDLLTMLRQMAEIRAFEDKVYDLLGQNIIKGASHYSLKCSTEANVSTVWELLGEERTG